MDEDKKRQIKDLLAKISKLIEEVLDEKEPVEEESGSGAVGGYAGPLGSLGMPKRRRYRTYTPMPEKKKR
tara:strand:+ start:1342 stop:1551 length:210 start_codon:yes stop_codon:yes gene_type:complete